MQKYLQAFGVATALYFAGCSSAPERHDRASDQLAPPLPVLTAEQTFAGGQLLVEASVSRGDRSFGRRGDGSGGGGERHPHPEPGDDEPATEQMRPRLHESTMPPIFIQLRATNQGTEPVEITWVECNSALGNFGVLPETMSLPPGESAETQRMTSLLGPSGDEIPLTVTLKAHGKSEKKTFILHPAPPDTKP